MPNEVQLNTCLKLALWVLLYTYQFQLETHFVINDPALHELILDSLGKLLKFDKI